MNLKSTPFLFPTYFYPPPYNGGQWRVLLKPRPSVPTSIRLSDTNFGLQFSQITFVISETSSFNPAK